MRHISHWEQLLDLTIDGVIAGPQQLAFTLNDGSYIVEFESEHTKEANIDVKQLNIGTGRFEIINPNLLVGRKIRKVVVPFISEGFHSKLEIVLGFDDFPDTYLVSELSHTPIRIT